MKEAYLDLEGANCPSCVFAIETNGRRVNGVSDIRVDTSAQRIHVLYEGNPDSLERIADIVRRLGYEARVRYGSISPLSSDLSSG